MVIRSKSIKKKKNWEADSLLCLLWTFYTNIYHTHLSFYRLIWTKLRVNVSKTVECVTANQAIKLQADSQSGHGTSIFPKGLMNPNFSLQKFCVFLSFAGLFHVFFISWTFSSGILPDAKEMFPFPLSLTSFSHSVSFSLAVKRLRPFLTWVMGKEPQQEFLSVSAV